MIKKAIILFAFIATTLTASAAGIDETINSIFSPIVGVLAQFFFFDPVAAMGFDIGAPVPFIVVWLVFGAVFFTIKMGFISLKGPKHSLELVQGKYDDPNDVGEVSHFQALTTALSATVGLGNIASVAVAITIGGPGATFWMIVAGILGMSTKFTECTLGVKYRNIDENGEVSGGPMYYLSQGLAKRNLAGLGKGLAIMFALLAVMASYGGGGMFQLN